MSLVERRVGPNNFNAPTTIYGAGVKSQLQNQGASSGHTGHNYEWVTEHVLDLAKDALTAEELFANYGVIQYETGIHVLSVEVTVKDVLDGGVTINLIDEAEATTALAVVDETATQGEILIGAGAGVGTNVDGPTALTFAPDEVGGATEGKLVVRVRFLRPIE